MADRNLRDTHLTWSMALLACALVLHLVGDSMRLTLLLDSRTSDAHRIAGWLSVISTLPLLAGASFGIVAFAAGRVGRRRWLSWALLLAGLGFALGFISSVFEYAALEDSAPEGMNLGLLATCLETFALTAGFLLAAAAISERSGEDQVDARDRRLRWPGQLLGIGLLFAGLASWAFTLAYSTYPHHDVFSRGLITEGFGAFAAGLALLYAAFAFSGGKAVSEEARIARREKRLAAGVLALGLSFLLVALGEVGRASGITALGYPESSAVADWALALSRILEAAAFLVAARGFGAVSRYARQG